MLRVLASIFALFALQSGAADVVKTPHAEVSLLSQSAALTAGQSSWVGLRIQHQPHWHTYWRNPGESGMPTTITWTLPAGVTVGDIAWPAPQRIPTGPLINYGYEGDLLLPMKVSVAAGVTGNVTLSGKANWLICKEVCIPEEGDVSLTLPVGSNASAASVHDALFVKALAVVPPEASSDTLKAVSAQRSDTEFLLRAPLPANTTAKGAYFYPYLEGIVEPSAPQAAYAAEGGLALKMKLAANAPATETVEGVLVIGATATALKTKVASTKVLAMPAASAAGLAPETLTGSGADLGLLAAVALAFVGGMILNLMPCVFPVLSIKILGFAQHAEHSKAAMRAHGMAYSMGVVATFLALAGALLAVRAAGSNVGWGFQLQHPVVIGGLALIFFLIGLNLLGVFELRFAPQVDGRAKNPLVNAFLSGVLAVVAASPCTAPFMGAALGFALTQSPVVSLAIFAALGVGMALPYALLSWFPAWLKKLPRPGPWMDTLKKWFSIPMFLTVAWLGWVLWLQIGPTPEEAAPNAAVAHDQQWRKWDVAAIDASVAQGKPVFVDFTAAWCVSCQANKRLVLNTADVSKAFAAKNVSLMRADWTKQDPAITDALKALGRSGVPVYVLHRPGKAPLVLPEVLTAGIVNDALATL